MSSDQPLVNPVDQQAFLRKRLDLKCAVAVAFSRESSTKSQEFAFQCKFNHMLLLFLLNWDLKLLVIVLIYCQFLIY